MSKTQLSPTGQPVMGTRIDVMVDDGKWIRVTVVGKFYGKGGNADLIGLAIESLEGWRDTMPWPNPYWRSI